MAIRQKVTPLDWKTPLVDPNTGLPSPQFIRLWQQLFVNEDVTNGEAEQALTLATQLEGEVNTLQTDLDAAEIDIINLQAAQVPTGGAAGEVLTKNTSTDYDMSWQPGGGGGGGGFDPFAKEFVWAVPTAGATPFTPVGGQFSTAGSVTGLATADTNEFTRRKNVRIANFSGVNTVGQLREFNANARLRQGINFKVRFGLENVLANSRIVVGMFATWPTTNDPINAVNAIFLGKDSADTNFSIFHNDGVGLCTKIPLGASFPANTASADIYDVEFTAAAGASSVDYVVTNRITSATASGTISTDLPAIGTGMFPGVWTASGSTSGQQFLNLFMYSRETDLF